MIRLKIAHENFVDELKSTGKAASTVTAYKKDIEQLVNHLLNDGVEHVHEVETDHLRDFMNKLGDLGMTNKTISRKTNATKTFFGFLKDNGHIQVDVSIDLEHPKYETKDPRILSKLEYRAVRDAARRNSRTYAMIEVLLQTGISISELSLMEMEHLNLADKSGHLHIPARESKDERRVPLNETVAEAIRKYLNEERPNHLEDAKHVFITKTGRPILVRNIRSAIDRVFKRAGVENAKVNDLRHTFIAHNIKQGADTKHLAKIVGHKRVSTTEKYLEYVDRDTEEVVQDTFIL